jgi:GAF domain-containing protein
MDYVALVREIQAGLRPGNPRLSLRRTVELLRRAVPHYNWVGIYLLDGHELVLETYSGPRETEHTRIPIGRGICGVAAAERSTIVVPDVTSDPRYLACFPSTRSEIVVPILRNETVLGEIDIDSDAPGAFGARDCEILEEVARLLAGVL